MPGEADWQKPLAQFSLNYSPVLLTRAGVTLVAAGPEGLCIRDVDREGRRT